MKKLLLFISIYDCTKTVILLLSELKFKAFVQSVFIYLNANVIILFDNRGLFMIFAKTKCVIPSCDGVHKLNGVGYIPVGTVKAAMLIIHGLCEHTELYTEFMSFLAEKGIAVFVYDQLGHGHTAKDLEELGSFAEENGDELLIKDAHNFAEKYMGDYTGVPHYLFGHSFGSFIARICAARYPDIADGIILAGTSGTQYAAVMGAAITDVKSRIQTGLHRSESSQRLFYDIFNMEFRSEGRNYSWLSSDLNEVELHEQDKLFCFTFTIKAMNDIVHLCLKCTDKSWYENIDKHCRVLILSGQNDPLGDFGKGVLEVKKRLDECGAQDVSLKIYSGARHEILHDKCKKDVCDDVLSWIVSYDNGKYSERH